MSNAVMIQGSSFSHCVPGPHCSAGLQRLPLPGSDEPPCLALSCNNDVSNTYSLSSASNRAASSTIEVHIDPSLSAAQLGSHLPVPHLRELTSILSNHTEVFAHGEDDLGLYEGVEHAIDLLPDAVPYSRPPYRYSAADRRFLEAQTSTLLCQGIVLPALGPWAFPAVVVSRGSKNRLCANYVPLNKITVSVREEDQAKTAFSTHHSSADLQRSPLPGRPPKRLDYSHSEDIKQCPFLDQRDLVKQRAAGCNQSD
ncbi:hypothetical protein HPB49_022579 [Dermacentor silvarum]|uniref:Uncharacterized protein n=1 Tax=Dermacentor silvarum TaxID=543639 RepID=A0ACB8CHQ8_DERSI|nr:hypothetical protein HPB49_022579 [Dermacentor silvarum]